MKPTPLAYLTASSRQVPALTMLQRATCLFLLAVSLGLPAHLCAQGKGDGLTNKEVEKLRDTAYAPDQRVQVFMGFLDDRTKALNDLFAKPRKPGREDDAHDLLEQFSSIADELEENLLDYRSHHHDLRKVLPKLAAATERWATELKTPPDDPRYKLTRKLALDAVKDIHDDTTELIDDQKAWFAAHPAQKEKEGPVQVN